MNSKLYNCLEDQIRMGESAEDILNLVTTYLGEAKEKLNKSKQREDYLNILNTQFAEKYDNYQDINMVDIAGLTTACAAKSHPEWNLENCKEFRDQVLYSITVGQKMIGKSDLDVVKMFFNCGTDRKDQDNDNDVINRFLKTIGVK